MLLTTLLILLLAVMLLSGIARYSLSIATEASDAQAELQRRWGAVSLRAVVLSRPRETLADYLRSHRKPGEDSRQLYPLVGTVRLGPLDFRLVLDDECRKLNLNRLYLSSNVDVVRQALLELNQGESIVRLRPHRGMPGKSSVRPFESWGQVFATEELADPSTVADWLGQNTQSVTCWGGGSVNFTNCSDQVFRLLARNALDPVAADQLLDLRRRNPALDLDKLLALMNSHQSDKGKLKDWLTDRSDCFSLWIDVQSQERSWQELLVSEASDGTPQVHRFVW